MMSTFSLEDRMDALERQHYNLQVNFTQQEKKLTAKLDDVSTKLEARMIRRRPSDCW
jgi:hypothetical protein